MKPFVKHLETFLPYLEDLRKRVYWSTIIFSLVFVGGFFSSAFVLKHFVAFFNIKDVLIATTSPFQFADLAVDIGFFFAIIVTLPLIIFHLYSFLKPALTSREKIWFTLSIPLSLLLFICGFIYGFFILYYSFQLLAELNQGLGIKNIWDIGTFLSQIFITSSLLGLVFQFPLILTIAIKLHFIDSNFLKEKRRVAFFIIFIIVSLLPPTDGLSLIAMALPLVVLYEATILININKKNYVWTRN
ncbi:MAG: twin-arginine translocase subunit TatC [Candidatus Zambryskibacteria bacterium]|nr:twin-arginine translocase subunit TatC [Candidatus Zambryskibacteria bacterium]